MARIQAYAANYCSANHATVIATGPGAIHTIIATNISTTPAQVTFYDNTQASGTILLAIQIAAPQPFAFNFKDIGPARFAVGLTVFCPTGCLTFVVTEQ